MLLGSSTKLSKHLGDKAPISALLCNSSLFSVTCLFSVPRRSNLSLLGSTTPKESMCFVMYETVREIHNKRNCFSFVVRLIFVCSTTLFSSSSADTDSTPQARVLLPGHPSIVVCRERMTDCIPLKRLIFWSSLLALHLRAHLGSSAPIHIPHTRYYILYPNLHKN